MAPILLSQHLEGQGSRAFGVKTFLMSAAVPDHTSYDCKIFKLLFLIFMRRNLARLNKNLQAQKLI